MNSSSANNRFLRQDRLTTPAEFKRVYKCGDKGRTDLFIFHLAKSDQSAVRLGITVSKKVSLKAVTRNRIKRQVKEFFRKQNPSFSNTDIVITAAYSCADADNKQIQNSLKILWEKILKQQDDHNKKNN